MIEGGTARGEARGQLRDAQAGIGLARRRGRSADVTAAPAEGWAQRRRSQHERRSEAEARLLEAARTLLSRKGWVGMTLAQVSEAAGYSRGQVTHHFGNKGALLRALTMHINRTFVQEMEAAPPAPVGLQAVLSYVGVYFGRSESKWINTRTLLLLLAEALLENADTAQVLADYNREMFAWLEDNLRLGIAQGEIHSDIDPALGAEFVVGAVRGLPLQRLLRGPVVNLREIKDPVLKLIEQAFASPNARSPNKGPNDER